MANPFEHATREKKVLEIVCVLRSRGFTADQAARLGLSRTGRQLMAKEAGQRMPSEKTWTRVVEVLKRLEATAPADPFQGVTW